MENKQPKVLTEEEKKAEEQLQQLGLKKASVDEQETVRHPPGTFFKNSYNAKGEKITRVSLEKQDIVAKLHKDDWKRFQFQYDKIFETDTYHLVKDRNSTQIYLNPNNPYTGKTTEYFSPKHAVLDFGKYSSRPDITKLGNFNCNQSRFENINKDPEILTRTKRVGQINFDKSTARTEFKTVASSSGGGFYDYSKKMTMGRLDQGSVDFTKSIDREPKPGIGIKVSPEASYDYSKAVIAKTRTSKPRVLSMADFGRTSPRDDIMLKQTDAYKNVMLENTKEDRELELRAKKMQSRQYPTTFMMRA